MAQYRYIPEYNRAAQERSRAAWEAKWEEAFWQGGKLGPKGQQYIESKYGPEIGDEEGDDDLPDDDWPDVYDIEAEEGDY